MCSGAGQRECHRDRGDDHNHRHTDRPIDHSDSSAASRSTTAMFAPRRRRPRPPARPAAPRRLLPSRTSSAPWSWSHLRLLPGLHTGRPSGSVPSESSSESPGSAAVRPWSSGDDQCRAATDSRRLVEHFGEIVLSPEPVSSSTPNGMAERRSVTDADGRDTDRTRTGRTIAPAWHADPPVCPLMP